MKTTRKIIADETGKNLFIKINGETITAPWNSSHFYIGETVVINVKKEKNKSAYHIRPMDARLPWEEIHWTTAQNVEEITKELIQ